MTKSDAKLLSGIEECLSYDPMTGQFVWIKPRSRRLKVGDRAGCDMKNGYRKLRFGREFYLHQLAWYFVHGEWPVGMVDHINRDPSDNRIENLRVCTPTESNGNRKVRSDSVSGTKGVSWVPDRKKWRARIGAYGRSKTLGYFATEEMAAQAYASAAQSTFGEFASVA